MSCLTTALAGVLFACGIAAAGQGLWVPNALTVAEFQGKNLKKPHRINRSADISGANAVEFDRAGNVWITQFNPNTITEFTRAQFRAAKKHPTPHAVVTISEDGGSNLDGPEGLAFDSSGNMWVGSERGQVVLMYSPGQYAASGNPTPAVILNASSFNFSSPSNVVFDGAGNLWVVDENIDNGNGGTGEAFRYNRTQISGLSAGTHHIDPAFGIAFSGFAHLEGLTFDGGGNLWIADESTDLIYKFSTSQIGGSGLSQNLTPVITLDGVPEGGACGKSINNPYGIAFDAAGNLYVANAVATSGCPGSLASFTASAVSSSGTPAPRTFITSNINDPGYLTIGPTP
jgi:sugar lactone lactonase YvrE